MMTTHPAYPKLLEAAKAKGGNVFAVLEDKLNELKEERGCPTFSECTGGPFVRASAARG
jgi:hypothetical protein